MREGDSISTILHLFGIEPIWGNRSKVRDTVRLNPEVVFDQGNQVSYSVMILLPVFSLPPSSLYKLNPDTLEVTFINPSPIPTVYSDDSIKQETIEEVYTPYKIVRISIDPNYTLINAQDKITQGKANIASNLNFDFGLSYRQSISSKLSLGAGVDLNLVKYESSANKAFENDQSTFLNMRTDLGYSLDENFSLLARFSFAQRPFIIGISPTVIRMETVGTFGIGSGFSWGFAEIERIKLSMDAGGGYLFRASTSLYTIEPGYFIFSTLRASKKMSACLSLEVSPYYRTDSQNTNILIDSTSEIGLKISSVFKL